ncbi:MAG TPA: cell division protein ZapE [Steroidobacteraceae bacterium]|nr:cell division protein ZapE [Steroidobacteraceae bacterium]
MGGGADLRELYARALSERGFSPDPEQRAALAKLDLLRRRLRRAQRPHRPRWLRALWQHSEDTPVRGVYLWGGVGRGKTFLMDLFFASLPFAQRRRQHFHRFMQDVHAALAQPQHERDPLEVIAANIAREVRVLCIDELQVTDIADAMLLGGLFAGLFRRAVTLVATSNTPPQDLYKDGLQRARFLPAIALLERHVEVLRLGGTTDYRLRELTQAGVYLPAAAAATPGRLEALFGRLAGPAVRLSGDILIEGRPIAVLRVGHDVVWFEFAALCVGPRSPDDYIEIAREYRTVMVSDVPVLQAEDDDAARRFIELIDELYDRNVNLIVSAAAPPPELYRGERLKAPFERTVSRLIEMQSSEYLAREHRS